MWDKEKWVLQEWTKAEMGLDGFMNMKIFTLSSPSDLGNGLKNKCVEHVSMRMCGRRQRVKRKAWSTLFHLDIYCFKMLERDDIFHTWFFLKYKANPLCIKQWRAFLRVRTLKDSCVLFYFFPSGQWMTSPLTPLTVCVEKLISLLPIKFSCQSEFLIKINILIVCPCPFPHWERS